MDPIEKVLNLKSFHFEQRQRVDKTQNCLLSTKFIFPVFMYLVFVIIHSKISVDFRFNHVNFWIFDIYIAKKKTALTQIWPDLNYKITMDFFANCQYSKHIHVYFLQFTIFHFSYLNMIVIKRCSDMNIFGLFIWFFLKWNEICDRLMYERSIEMCRPIFQHTMNR